MRLMDVPVSPASTKQSASPPSDLVHAFALQIAGHSHFLKLEKHRVCKSFTQNESFFYQTVSRLHPSLVDFIPRYHGLVELLITPEKIRDLVNEVNVVQNASLSSVNPWTKELAMTEITQSRYCVSPKSYLVLDDLTARFTSPCIMDIKLGTRQFGDEASPEKRRHMIEKAACTTTSTLGLRICGQQVYHPRTGTYVVLNKHQGRRVGAESFPAALRQFFFDGSSYRTDVLAALTERLRQLLAAYESSPTAFRLYSTSLLLMYEGEPGAEPRVDVRMIDFAHTHPYEPGTALDDGYAFGLRNLLGTLAAIIASLPASRASATASTATDAEMTAVRRCPTPTESRSPTPGSRPTPMDVQPTTTTPSDAKSVPDPRSTPSPPGFSVPRRASAGSLMCPPVSCKLTSRLARSHSADYIALH